MRVLNKRDSGIPPGAVYIGRPSVWGNPFTHLANASAGTLRVASREEAVAAYERWIRQRPELLARLDELRGKDLVCWCAPLSCHGDVLIKLLKENRTL